MANIRKLSFFEPFRRFLREYRRSKLGVAGALIIIFFFFVAVLAPVLATHNPVKD